MIIVFRHPEIKAASYGVPICPKSTLRQAKRGETAPFLQRPMSETVLVILNRPCPKQLLACDGFKSFMIFMFIPRYSKIFQGKFRTDMNGFTGIHCFLENSIEPMA